MIDWLRRDRADPVVEIDGRELPLALRRHPRARRMTMRLAPDGSEIRITLPPQGRTAEALEFARSRSGWLGRQLQRTIVREAPGNGSTLAYRGRDHRVLWDAKAARGVRVLDGEMHLGGPEDRIADRLERWLRQEAVRLSAVDLAFFCDRAGIEVPAIRLSRAQRRWGSCSSAGTVRINWRLAMAPDAVRRSVVAHETAHLVHFDHSRAFHALLDRIYDGDLPAADRWLKQHGRGLYAPFG
ncbi:SprT family zinc-dependent metalloprotease [Qipengyuania sp. JC766]|uniref:M48 family metallopeptidase n=1 Tax=Qipengyuania sp. JC766 TaxID=3232139 RepID=UPI0034577E8E